MNFLDPSAHHEVLTDDTTLLAELLWFQLRAIQDKRSTASTTGNDGRSQLTDLGREIGRDEIHWWVFKKEDDIDTLRARTVDALGSADRLKRASRDLRGHVPDSYPGLLALLRDFAGKYRGDIQVLRDYAAWLYSRNPIAPSILFSYRVWGSTRRGDRWADLEADSFSKESKEKLQLLTEIVLGLRHGGVSLYAWDRAYMEIGMDLYDADPERGGEIDVSDENIAERANWEVLGEFATYFEWTRNSLRNIVLDIDRSVEERELLHSDEFWRDFILATTNSKKQETQLWDFKETLTIWHTKGQPREDAKKTFAEDVASFANADGGVLIIGVDDKRQIVGLGEDVESKLKFAADVLAERLEYAQRVCVFHQVEMTVNSSQRTCLIVASARTFQAVGVGDGAGHFSYPVRRETGISRPSRLEVTAEKIHFKSDSYEFLKILVEFIKDNPPPA